MMNKLHPYLVAAIVLLLLAGPWLHSAEVRASSDETSCNCCQGACQGCCCAGSGKPKEAKPDDEQGGCSCEMSNLPALPTIPMEFHERRLADKAADLTVGSQPVAHPEPELNSRQFTFDKSPPPTSPRPVYVLFSTLLI